ncbi:MAG: hypothetical protein V4474_01785 [Patescibacteria group bacterium]
MNKVMDTVQQLQDARTNQQPQTSERPTPREGHRAWELPRNCKSPPPADQFRDFRSSAI